MGPERSCQPVALSTLKSYLFIWRPYDSCRAHIIPVVLSRCTYFQVARISFVCAGHDDVITRAAALHAEADCTLAASIALTQVSSVMMGRDATSVIVSHDLYEELLAATDRLSASLKQIV